MNSMSNAQKQLVVGELGKEHLVIRGNVFFSASKKQGFNISFSQQSQQRKLKNEFSFFQLVGYGLSLWSVLISREDKCKCMVSLSDWTQVHCFCGKLNDL